MAHIAPSVPRFIIIGQGLAGTCLGWALYRLQVPFVIVDKNPPSGSSRVAAGLLNPVTGKGLNPSWRLKDFLPSAHLFYKELEDQLEEHFWHPLPVARLFVSEKERIKYQKKEALLSSWRLNPNTPSDQSLPLPDEIYQSEGGVLWKGGGWLDTGAFLKASRQHLPMHLADWDQVKQEYQSPNDHLIFCRGATDLLDPKNQPLPQRLAKGEILTIRIPGLHLEHILVKHGWIIPLDPKAHLYRAGATYDWDRFDSIPSQEGLCHITRMIESFTSLPFQVIEHKAGIRPIMRRSRPVIGVQDDRHWFLNGLGSKGTLYAPKAAMDLAQHLVHGHPLDPDYLL